MSKLSSLVKKAGHSISVNYKHIDDSLKANKEGIIAGGLAVATGGASLLVTAGAIAGSGYLTSQQKKDADKAAKIALDNAKLNAKYNPNTGLEINASQNTDYIPYILIAVAIGLIFILRRKGK
jgi:hypothetical protein